MTFRAFKVPSVRAIEEDVDGAVLVVLLAHSYF